MPPILIYEAKVAVVLLVFYLFYRFLLKKETFHRFNRVVLVGTVVLSFLLPFCIVTIRRPMELAPTPVPLEFDGGVESELVPMTEVVGNASCPWWPTALTILFFAGAAFVLARVIVSILSLLRIIRRGECVGEEDGCRIIVTERDIDPFSWMRYIVLSRKDWEAPHAPILAHERAHIGYGHSAELLLVDVLSAFQWFNPALWMLRADLQELHEYEADDAVLRTGANLKEYQYLLIRKAVSKSGYSVANSFNHSILKNRITMMSKSRSPLARGWRALYLLPLVCLGIGLQARTVYVPVDKDSEKNVSDENGRALLPEIVVVKYADASVNPEDIKHGDALESLQVKADIDADAMPECSENFAMWLNRKLDYPRACLNEGAMLVRFTVDKNGKVGDVEVIHGVSEELDKAVAELVAKSPVWTPAKKNGKPVAVKLVQPVVFVIRTPKQPAAGDGGMIPLVTNRPLVLKIRPDGKIDNVGKVLEVAELKEYIQSLGYVNAQTTVSIMAAADTPMRIVDEVKEKLREVKALKVYYVKPESDSGVTRYLPPTHDMDGKLIQKSPRYPAEYPKDVRENMCVVRINSADKVLFGSTPLSDDEKMVELGKSFVRSHGKEAMFNLGYDNGTSYGAYQHIQEVLRRVYDELRDEKAQELYGKPLSSLSESERDDILKQIPLTIVEAAKQ